MSEKELLKTADELHLYLELSEVIRDAFFRGMDHRTYKPEENGIWITNKANSTTQKLMKKSREIIT